MSWTRRFGRSLVPVAGALAFSVLLLLLAGADPLEALGLLVEGSVGSAANLSDTLTAWVTMVLAAAGLVVTFRAGLWNIGVEGQVIAGYTGLKDQVGYFYYVTQDTFQRFKGNRYVVQAVP